MENLVKVTDGTPTTTASVIARGIGVNKKSVSDMIEKYSDDFKEVSAFEMRKVITPTKGRPVVDWVLDEPQSSLLIMMMRNSEKARGFKVALIKEFYKLRTDANNGIDLLNKAYKELEEYQNKGKAWSEFGRHLAKVKPEIQNTVASAEKYAQLCISFNKIEV
jgi:phage regulator Rha-like protein